MISIVYDTTKLIQLVEPVCIHRAHPGSEFVVAKPLAKWKKLEPNEINCSQGFSQKEVSTSCFVFNSLPARGDFCCLLIALANSFRPEKMSSDGIEKIQHLKSQIWHNNKM